MQFELTKSQRNLLQYLEDCGGRAPIASWMKTATIASLQRRNAIELYITSRDVKLKISHMGYVLLSFVAQPYLAVLNEVKHQRRYHD